MALLPLLFDDLARPSPHDNWISLFRQPEELLHPLRSVLNQIAALDKDNSIQVDKDKFQANVDIQQFKPEEITVRLEGDNTVIVEGKHEEKQDEHGFISRHFVRRYVLPDDVDAQKVQSRLSSDGVLSISAPKKPDGKQIESKQIPISLTGPLKTVEQKGQQGETKKE
ncbi:protein lethal(2)essential for life-like [Euwallacea fornicatus]|uniref:protein lethal(2)essential for life-like n=1 Tax=Euwallacea fornicatus TaxID=995702 RepID=UPI00338F5527